METAFKKTDVLQDSANSKRLLSNIVSYIFIFLFIYTATDKLWKIQEFQDLMMKFTLLHAVGKYVAWSIPSIEIIISILLLIPTTRLIGLISSFGLVVIFTIYLIFMKLTVPVQDLPCHCGGIISKMTWIQHIWFNCVLIAMAAFAILQFKKSKKKDIDKEAYNQIV